VDIVVVVGETEFRLISMSEKPAGESLVVSLLLRGIHFDLLFPKSILPASAAEATVSIFGVDQTAATTMHVDLAFTQADTAVAAGLVLAPGVVPTVHASTSADLTVGFVWFFVWFFFWFCLNFTNQVVMGFFLTPR
jgi:hypothetical protein